MQGHGIGAGLTLGLFADVVLLSEESRYVSPYMDYGFTPGAGATYILGDAIGRDLARETLLTARPYAGTELKARGLRLLILPRTEVYTAAMVLARQIAQTPRHRLIELKRQLTGYVREALEETYRLELAMHDKTFVGRFDTLAQIQTNFYPEIVKPTVDPTQSKVKQVPSVGGDVLSTVTARLKTLLANELLMRESDIDEDAQFVDLGLDSISGVAWVRKINEKYQTSIEPTKVYSYPTLAQLSRYVQAEANRRDTPSSPGAPPAEDSPVAPANSVLTQHTIAATPAAERLTSWRSRTATRFISSATAPNSAQPIAVIGMAGQFPQAKNLDEFWENIAEGRNCITAVPPSRWDLNAYYQPGAAVAGKTNSQWVGALDEYDLFDPLFFNISPTEAECMDPQQRLFLQACWHGIENAGYDARSLSGSKCGVFVGCATGDYHQLSRRHQLSAQGFTGNAMSILAARISYLLNLQGPCVSIDTACSSSLVAIAQACDSLTSGGSDLALAGGVYVMAGPEMHIRSSQVGMFSPEGRCFTFDQRADGFVPGEGVGVVMLKRLADARRDQDMICGVIQGWGVNQDGRTNGITAPNPESQTRLERDVYDKYLIDSANIRLIEAHGTGTKLGDPIEVEALKEAFKKHSQNKDSCALGSVKSNIGHCLTAAGIAGVIKLVLALQHKQLPPTINFEYLNEHIDLNDSPFYVNTRLRKWERDGAQGRQAAISAFGFSGTNAHLVIGEYLSPAEVERPVFVIQDTKTIIPLSARTVDQLQQKALDLLDFIRQDMQSVDFVGMAYTLQAGRAAMDERLGFVVSSVEQLAEKLQAYVNGEQGIEEAYRGHVKRDKEALSLFSTDDDLQQTIDKWLAGRKLSKLLDLWVKGLELDWSKLYGETKPQRISLPAYPFAKERYWINTAASEQGAANSASPSGPTTAVLHPLLHCNTSDLSEQRYRSTFTGEEFFLTDHQVRVDGRTGQKMLPAVVYLEMARAAIEHASPARPESTVLELTDTVWAQPIVVSDSRQVSIALLADGNERIDFEIYSEDAGREIVHCQGRGVLSRVPAPVALDIEQLKAQMKQGKLEPDSVYACTGMDLVYGPAFRGITAIYRGSGQLLAQLRLPNAVADEAGDYVLHPSLIDGALQAAVLLSGEGAEPNQPRWPLALESLRVLSPPSSELFAWVRYAHGSQKAENVVKLDIDVCDERGNVCVQMAGLSSRVLSAEIITPAAQGQAIGSLFATPIWQACDVEVSAGADSIEYAGHHIVLCELSRVNAEKLASLVPRSRCLSLKGGQPKNIAERYSEYALVCFERIQAILQGKPQGKVLVQIVVANDREQALFAGLSGLLKTAALENPQLIGQLILITPESTTEELAKHLEEEKSRGLDPLIKYEQGTPQVLRWQEVREEQEKPPMVFQDRGVYLITGGLGGLGLLFANEILERTHKARVVLTGRSAFSAEKRTRLDGLSAEASRLSYRQVDLADLDQVEQLIASIQAEHGQLNGILHGAGMIADNFILKKTNAEFNQVLAPKVTGAFNLDQASRDVELDFFVLFSSLAGAVGNPGQADYAAANGFMDQLAAYRNRQVAAKQRHGRTRSINWPLWQAGGMGVDPASHELLLQTTGMQPMQTATGLHAFYRSLAMPYDQTLVVEGNRPKIITYLQKVRAFKPLSHAEAAASHQYVNSDAIPAVSLDQLQQQLKVALVTILRIETSTIDMDQPFVEFGLDSFLGAELIVAVNKQYGMEFSHIILFDHPTVRDLSLFLEREFKKSPGRPLQLHAAPASRAPVPKVSSSSMLSKRARVGRATTNHQAHSGERIAIVGMSGRYPEARSLEQYWDNLVKGRNSIAEVPATRWDVDRYYDPDRSKKDKTYSKWLGALDDIDCFDPLFFRISPHDAEYMDPQHRMFLQESYKAFEDAGYASDTLSNKNCGVYLGISTNEYMSRLLQNGVVSAPVTSNSAAIAAARIAYYLNLKGPAISVDTACSSSLVAMHLASQALMSREIDMALAGGVSTWLTPESYLAMSQAGMFSAVGQCKTFDDTADGIVNGEGVGVVLLKRLDDAERDNDFIYGVMLGSGINQDGKTNGITAPSVNSQIELERGIYAKYGIDPETISYVETHGTGTRLGDPIELEALATVFSERTTKKNFCALGSVKSNIGHTTSAAGVAGVQKVLLSMRHRTLVPSLNVTRENSRFDFKESPFYISRETRAWDVAPGSLRRAAVSSFGFSGTNAHLVIEEYSSPTDQAISLWENTAFIVPLSARTSEQLRQRSRDLLEFIRRAQQPIDLAAIAYTLQVGREAMEARLGLVVSSVHQLVEKLSGYISGEKHIEDVYQGLVEPSDEGMTIIAGDDDMQEAIDRWIARRKLSKLLDLWIRGLNVDWNKLYGAVKPRRIPLPTYPFAKERYWIETMSQNRRPDSQAAVDGSAQLIEAIFNKLGDDTMESGQAVQALRMLM
jgi:polyketide synthase PksL